MVPDTVKNDIQKIADALIEAAAGTTPLTVTGGGGGTQYNEDAAHTSGDTGTMVLAVRQDVIGNSVSAEGDYGTLKIDGFGRLYVKVDSSALPSGAATSAKQDTEITSLQLLDDTVYADDAAFTLTSSKMIATGAIRDDSLSTLSAAENDVVPLRVSSTGALHVTGGGGGTEYTEDVATANPIVGTATMIERDDVLSTVTPVEGDNIGLRGTAEGALWTQDFNSDAILSDTTAIATSVASIDTDTTTIIGHVDGIETLLTSIDTDTGNMDTSLNNIETAVQIMDDWDNAASDGASVSGDVAHDTADAGEPIKIGGKAFDLGATPTAVAANDRTNATFLRNGVQLILGGDPNVISKNLNITDADGAQTDTAIITVSAGTAIVVTKVSVMADGANSGDVAVRIGFGTASTPAADAAGIVLAHPGIKAGSGVVEGNGAGIIGIGASNEDLRLTCEDPAGGSIDIIVTYFTILIG